jgi:hypothetical protein
MFGDFAEAYVHECQRRNPIRAKEVGLSKEEMQNYLESILKIHLMNNAHDCPVWRQAKILYIPTWIQFVISKIGTVWDVAHGRKFIPTFAGEDVKREDMDALIQTSNKIRQFMDDGLTMHKDAFPRDTEGDLDFMSYAIIDNYVKSVDKDAHPIASYVAAFVGMKLQEEAAFKILYSVRYDDVDFIKSQLFADDTIIK